MQRVISCRFLICVAIISSVAAVHSEDAPAAAANLPKILDQAFEPGADWKDLLSGLNDYNLETAEDTQAVCKAIDSLLERKDLLQPDKSGLFSVALSLTGLFQNVKKKPAYDVARQQGMPRLEKLFDALYAAPEKDTHSIFLILKVLSIYITPGGADRVLRAAQDGFHPDSYMWSIVFSQYQALENPHTKRVFDTLRKKLPSGFIAVALLVAADEYFTAGGTGVHPFNSPEGHAMLRTWLRSTDEKQFSYAHSATSALLFMEDTVQAELLDAAVKHPDAPVRREAGWVLAKLGREQGIELLARECLNVHQSKAAQACLKELKREDAVPAKCKEPDFLAMAEMSEWLQYPTEMGRAPDTLELYDARSLFWPPTGNVRPVWLFKYEYLPKEKGAKTMAGVGMVGSMTFALFEETKTGMTPEKVYAMHCSFELENNHDPRAEKKRTIEGGMAILKKYNPGFGDSAK